MSYQPGHNTGSAPPQYGQPPPGQYSGGSGYGAPAAPQTTPYGTPGAPQPTPYGTSGAAQTTPYGTPGAPQTTPYGTPGAPQTTPYGTPGAPQNTPYGTSGAARTTPYGTSGAAQTTPYGTPAAPQLTPYGTPAAPQSNPYGTPAVPQPTPYGAPQQQTMYGAPSGSHPGAQSSMPGYSAAPYGAPAPAVDPMWASFSAVAGTDGKIDAVELCKCLSQSGFTGSYKPFTQETCKILIALLDRDRSGKMEFSEYKELWNVLAKWKQTFESLDKDRSGSLDAQEISSAVNSFGYRLSPTALAVVMQRYNTNGKVYFDDFIALTTRIRSLSNYFISRDTNRQGSATLAYDDFMTHTMSC